MNIKQHIANHLVEVHRGGNWTDVNITDTLKDVNWQQAAIITSFSPNSIAMLLHHITYWNRIIAIRGQNIEPEINEQNGMNAPALMNEADWDDLKKDNLHSAEELATIVEGYDIGGLYNPILPGHSSAYKNFQGQVEHVHYHLGQIVMIKKYLQANSY
jgi:hypothetical protein